MSSSNRLLLVAALPLVACTIDAADDSSPDISVDIATSDVIARAEQWVDAKLHYCQAAYDAPDGDNSCWGFEGPAHRCDRESNSAWNKYRSDCSGFVTWAWGLPPVGDGGYVTGDFAPFDDSFSHAIALDDLQPGDALNKVTNEHIVLFKQWITKGESAVFLEEPGCSVSDPYAHEFTSQIHADGPNAVIDYEGSTPFTPIRFDGIVAPSEGTRVAVAPNENGKLQLFYLDEHNAIQHMYQKEAGGFTGWNGPDALGGSAKSLALGKNKDGRLELFYVGTNGVIYHNWQDAPNGAWHGQAKLDGKAKQLVVGTNADGRLEIFYIGTNDHIYHDYQKKAGGWSGEQELRGEAKQLVVGNNPNGSLELVYVGTNDHLYENYQNGPDGGWHGQADLEGDAKRLALGHHPDGRLELFYIGTNNALYHDYQKDDVPHWSGQLALGGEAKQIAAGEDRDGAIELFYVGTDDALYHNYQAGPNNRWVGQHRLEGDADQIAVGMNSDGRLELFYVGTDDALYHNWQKTADGAWAGQNKL